MAEVSRADTDVRDVIAKAICTRYESIEFTGSTPDEWVNEANAVLAALARAGLVVVPAEDRQRWYHLDQSRTECVAGHDSRTRLCAEGGGEVISEVQYLTQVLEITRGLLRSAEDDVRKAEQRADVAEAKLREIESGTAVVVPADDLDDALNNTGQTAWAAAGRLEEVLRAFAASRAALPATEETRNG